MEVTEPECKDLGFSIAPADMKINDDGSLDILKQDKFQDQVIISVTEPIRTSMYNIIHVGVAQIC